MKKGIILLAVLATFTGIRAAGIDTDRVLFSSVQGETAQFKEIEIKEVPKPVNEAMKEYFADYQVNKAFKNDDGLYRLEVSREDIHYVLYYDEKGELIKVDQPENSKEMP